MKEASVSCNIFIQRILLHLEWRKNTAEERLSLEAPSGGLMLAF
jgi:hypothetical protein